MSDATETGATPFGRFWAVWPRAHRGHRVYVVRAWLALAPGPELAETIIAALTAQAASPAWRAGQVPRPTAWLARRGWEQPAATAAELEGEFRAAARRRSALRL
jgi:hypothetical protein